MITMRTFFEKELQADGKRHRLTATISNFETPADEEALLTEGIQTIVDFLVQSARGNALGSAVIDLRTSDSLSATAIPSCFAYIEAVRGLLQAHTLERGPGAPAANLVVSTVGQTKPRERTLAYLESPGGSFSRGATYDLREDIA